VKSLVREELSDYCNDIITGKIVACQKHRWACERFFHDLKRSDAEEGNFPYIFNPPVLFDSGEVNKKGNPIMVPQYPADRYFDWMTLFKHSKGDLAGKQKIPVFFEKFVYGNIYGWVFRGKHYRRFNRSYEQYARKTAKSQDKAIQTLYEISAFGELSAEAYVAASNVSQTRFIWGEADWLIKNTPDFSDRFTIKFDQIFKQVIIRHKKSGGIFARLSKDDKKIGDGANPSFWVLDEYHLQESTEYYDLGVSGGKHRRNFLLSIVTTAGFNLANPCYAVEYNYVKKLLNPDIDVENDRYFVFIMELETDNEGNIVDDIKDERNWPKANPLVIESEVVLQAIRDDLRESLDKPEKMRDFLTKTCNIWINMKNSGYMNMEKWKNCLETKTRQFPDVTGLTPYPGIDLAAVHDICSAGFLIPYCDDEIAIISQSFVCEERYQERMKTGKIRWDLWRDQGFLIVTPGAAVDYNFVLEWIIKQYEKYGWKKGRAGFDRMMATWLAGELEKDKVGLIPVDIPQSYTGLSEATKKFREWAYAKKLIHNNPLLTWAVSNAVVRKGPTQNIMLDKEHSEEAIDPLAALINGTVLLLTPDESFNAAEFANPEFLQKLWPGGDSVGMD
jgi:phage terminase large subunit-like protein